MIVEVSGLARADLDEIFGYYENRRPGLGQEFITELHRAAERIIRFPRRVGRGIAQVTSLPVPYVPLCSLL
jgi:plasmid stabilization system protein ParE